MKGLQAYLSDSQNYESDEANNVESPLALAQIGLTNNRNAPITIFNGYAELISAIWTANGEPTLLYDVCVMKFFFFPIVKVLRIF